MRYRPSYHCTSCSHAWKGKPASSLAGLSAEQDAEYKIAMFGTPPCPNCGAVTTPRGIDLSLNRAPATIGASIQVKAIDETQKIVTEDYGLTDIRSDVRPGETAAPKLPPVLQRQADNFFMGRGKSHPDLPARASLNPAFLRQAALSGAFRQPQGYQPIENLHSAPPEVREQIRPPVRIVAGTR